MTKRRLEDEKLNEQDCKIDKQGKPTELECSAKASLRTRDCRLRIHVYVLRYALIAANSDENWQIGIYRH